MEIVKVDSYEEVSQKAAESVAGLLHRKQDAVIGLATGSTPEGMYARLVRMYRENEIDFSSVSTFNLDEYLGLSRDHPQSYHTYMHRHFFDHVNVDPERINIPRCGDEPPELVCRDYEKKLKDAGGLDLQILGIGTNGHVGFNEPAAYLYTDTHVVDLAEETIEANSRFFKSREEVPGKAVTMGVGSIMGAARIVLLASGRSKAKAIRDMCSGKITTFVPASLLQLHKDVTIIADREAARLLP